MKITGHFDSEEFDCKDGTPYPKEWHKERLKPLCRALEGIRSALGDRPIEINSGYRTPAYNKKIGGTRSSQHLVGRAADIKVKGISAQKVHDVILELIRDSQIKITGLGEYPTFTHVDIRTSGRLVRWNGSRRKN